MLLSYLIVDDADAFYNEFFEDMAADFWNPTPGFSETMTTFPDLETIIYGGASTFLDKSFYEYSGSESTPPCGEGIIRIVMK